MEVSTNSAEPPEGIAEKMNVTKMEVLTSNMELRTSQTMNSSHRWKYRPTVLNFQKWKWILNSFYGHWKFMHICLNTMKYQPHRMKHQIITSLIIPLQSYMSTFGEKDEWKLCPSLFVRSLLVSVTLESLVRREGSLE